MANQNTRSQACFSDGHQGQKHEDWRNLSSRSSLEPRTSQYSTNAVRPEHVLHSCLPAHNHDNDVDELQDHLIMAIDKTSRDRTGCAYYIARHELLCCMQDVEHGEPEILETLRLEIEPTLLLLSSRTDDGTVSKASQRQSSLVNDGSYYVAICEEISNLIDVAFQPLPYEILIRPSSDFRYDNAITKLSNLNSIIASESIRLLVPGENVDYNEDEQQLDELGLVDQQGKLLNIAGNIDLNNKASVGCIGAILGYLQRKKASEFLQHDPTAETAYRISRLEMFTLKNSMLLDAETLSSLQIVQSETHPNIANQGPNTSGSKESLSVYGLFHHFARTPQGKARLRQLFLRPSTDRQTIVSRHDFVSIFKRPENHHLCDALSKSLARVKNMQSTIVSLRKGVERGSDKSPTIRSGAWATLLEFCYHAIDIRDSLREVTGSETLALLASVNEALDKSRLRRIGKMIHDVVDLDESLSEHRTVIKRGVDENLDKIKDAYDGMEEVLARVAAEITNTMPENINQRLNIVFLPQLGFHVAVPLNENTKAPIWSGDSTWERRFNTDRYQYFKNDKMRVMDIHWGDLHAVICDTEIEISHELAQRVLQDADWLIKASDICGELDSLLALTHGAYQYDLSRPKIVDHNIIDIKGGRHLLQEMTVASYVPNDTLLVGGEDNIDTRHNPTMLLLTGPNYSGKSVYKKQVALIVCLAQIGSFVPAHAATLGVTDKILTRINTAESVSKAQSAFVIDLQQMARALKLCSNQSLVVIDEFGKGTDNCDGAGLASGVYKYLLELPEPPRVLGSTHFHEIFERGDFDKYPNIAFAHMEARMDYRQCQNGNQSSRITYLYNLREGRSIQSYGNQCAAMNGIPSGIVARATLLARLVSEGEDLVAICATLPGAEFEELEDAEFVCRKFLTIDFGASDIDAEALLKEICTPSTDIECK